MKKKTLTLLNIAMLLELAGLLFFIVYNYHDKIWP